MKAVFILCLFSALCLAGCSTRYEEELRRDDPARRDSLSRPHKAADTSDYDQVDL